MKNLQNYNTLNDYSIESSVINNTYLYIHGISEKYLFDEYGEILLDEKGLPIISHCLNFDSYLTRISESPDIFNNEEYLYINWDRKNTFDYQGLAVICDEVVYIESSDFINISPNNNEIRLKVKRNQNNTKHTNIYPENTIIRSVVNITYKTIDFNFETRSDVVSTNLFSPVIDQSVITITDNMTKWANYNENKIYSLKRKLPIYIFNGNNDEVVCDYVGFLDSFNIDSISNRIQLISKDKMSTLWSEKIKSHKIYKNITIADFLSDFLDIPRNMIIYPLNYDNGVVFDNVLNLHTWKGSIYKDKHFLKIDVLSTKDFDTYASLLQSATKELMFRMKFDTYERLVIQSDVLMSNETDLIYNNKLLNSYRTLDENQDITTIQQDNNNLIVINKINGSFIERNTFYDQSGFLLNHIIFDKYYIKDKIDNNTCFEESNIYNITNTELTSDSPYITNPDGTKKIIQVALILEDSNYNNKTTWYKWSVIPSKRYDNFHGEIPSVSWGWVFKGYVNKKQNKEDYQFFEPVKYQYNKKIQNASIMKYDANNVPEFSVLTKLGKKNNKNEYEKSYNIKIGENVKYLKIGDYVLITDGIHDFMGSISDISYGTYKISIDAEYSFETEESTDIVQKFDVIINKIDNVSRLLLANGKEVNTGWTFNKETHRLIGEVSDNIPYHKYEKPIKLEVRQDYNKEINKTMPYSITDTSPFPGKYIGTLTIQDMKDEYGKWEDIGEERKYETTDHKPTVGDVLFNEGIADGYAYRTIYTNITYDGYRNYKDWFNTYVRQQRAKITKVIDYAGTLSLITYKYKLFVNGIKNKLVEDEEKDQNASITVMCGYDKDYPLNYWGRHEYLDSLGYVNKPMDIQLFYVRNEFPYVYEYRRQDKTNCMEYPILPNETLEFNGDFGGIDSGEKKFAKIVDGIDNIYGQYFGMVDTNEKQTIAPQLLYSREYHQPIPVYIRTNKIKPKLIYDKNNVLSSEKMEYITFDNRDICLNIKSGKEKYKENVDFLNIDNLYEAEGSKKDISVNISNMLSGENFKIRTLSKTKAYRLDNDLNKIEININENSQFKVYSWDQNDCDKYYIDREYKIQIDNEYYYINKSLCKKELQQIKINKVFGKRALKIDNTKYKFNVGDVIVLDENNDNDINTHVIYSKYNNARWQIKGIDRNYDSSIYDLLYLDYEFPIGENNIIPIINQYKYTDIIMFQEFGIKGNPFMEEVHTIKYENTTSIEQYGEHSYDSITGKFIKTSDLNTALSYIIDGFSAISKETTKFVLPLGCIKKFELELFDIVKINESYYTGMKQQTGIITGIKHSFNGTETQTIYTVFTLGKYDRSNNVSIKDSQDYEPIELPEYSENGSSNDEHSNLLNELISKTDKNLGNIMLLKISSDNLSAKFKNTFQSTDNIITIDSISSSFDNTKYLKNKKYYTDILLDIGQELFISNGNEFIYAKVINNKKEAQSYDIIDDSKKDVSVNKQYVADIVSEAVLQVKQRGVFDTIPNAGQQGEKVGLYQITNMANADGNYTTSMLIGDKPHREYFDFSIKDGLDITSTRGRLLFNTNKNWYIQAKQILYDYYDNHEIDILSEDEIQDYLGKGIIQIGQSATVDIKEWKPHTEYIAGDYVSYKNNIYRCKDSGGHISGDNFTDNEFYWEFKYSSIEYGQFFRYSPVGGLELKGKVDIDSGSFKINDYNYSNNYMHLTDKVGYFGIGTGSASLLKSLLSDNKQINSFIQIGDFNNNGGLTFYDDNIKSVFKIRTKDFNTEILDSSSKKVASLILNNREQIFTLNENGQSENTIFKIGVYNGSFVSSNDHIYYRSKNGASELSIKSTKGIIGNNNSYIFFDNSKDIYVQPKWIFSNTIQRDQYFGIYTNSHINGGTQEGNNDFNNIISNSQYNINTYIKVNGNYEYFDWITTSWKIYYNLSSSSIYLNNGMQQLGNNVKDTVNKNGYAGMYIGMQTGGIGDIYSGQYIKFDGKDFMIGENVNMYYGNTGISFKDMVLGGNDNNTGGTTTFFDNKIIVYNSTDTRFIPLQINSSDVYVKSYPNTNIIYKSQLSPSVNSFSIIPGIIENKILRFINTQNKEDIIESIITEVNDNEGYFTINKFFPENYTYKILREDPMSVLLTLGDLKKTPDIHEPIRIGDGVYIDNNTGESAIGLYLRDYQDNHFKFDTIQGLSIQSNNGIIDIKNTLQDTIHNRLFFDKINNSYLSMNKGLIQIGKLSNINISSLNKYNDKLGMYLGSNDLSKGYLAYSPENGLTIKGNLYIENGDKVEDLITENNDKINDEINNIQQSTIYSDTMPTNILWKKNINEFLIYDVDKNIWKTVNILNNKTDTNAIYKDEDNKYYIYNKFSLKWIPMYVITSIDEPDKIAKTDTIWIRSTDNTIYRYNPDYNFNFSEKYTYDINDTNILSSITLKYIGLSDYLLQIAIITESNHEIELLVNSNTIEFTYDNGLLTANIKPGILKIGTNIISIRYKNSYSGYISMSSITIKSIGLKKWDSTLNPTEIYTNSILDTKNSIFTLKELPEYKNFKKCTGKIYNYSTSSSSYIYGNNTKFISELNNGDIIKYKGITTIVDEIINDTQIKVQGIIEIDMDLDDYYVLLENWETIPYDSLTEFAEVSNPLIQTVGRVVRHGLKDKIDGIQYDIRYVIGAIRDNKIYTYMQKITRLFPFEFTIDDIRLTYNDPTFLLKPKDVLNVIHYYSVNESATFTYFPRNRNLHKPISIMDAALNDIDYRDFILSSSSNDKSIFIQTNKSKLFFSSDPYVYDEVLIANNDTYGRLSVGSLGNPNHLFYDSELGLDISTQNSINITGQGSLNIYGGVVDIGSNSRLSINSGGILEVKSGNIDINSGSMFSVSSYNSEFTQQSSLKINSKIFSVNAEETSIISNNGTLLFSNQNSELYFGKTNESRILLGVNKNTVSPNTMFQLGNNLIYDDNSGLALNNARITLMSNNNILTITPDYIVSKKIENASKYNVDIRSIDTTFIYNEYLTNKFKYKSNTYNIFNYIYTISSSNKLYTNKNIIEIPTNSNISIIYLSNINTKIDAELIHIVDNKYYIYTKNYELEIQILIN